MAAPDPAFLSLLAGSPEQPLGLRALSAAAVLSGTLGALAVLNLAAPQLGLLDHPDGERKRHARPIPLTGGPAILAGAALGLITGMSVGATPLELLALLAIVAVIHAIDDQATDQPGLTPRQRLVIDATVALAVILVTGSAIRTLGTVGDVALTLGALAIPFTILIYLTLTNAYNMIDGLDGLALSQFLIAFAGLAFWQLGMAGQHGIPPLAAAITLASLVVLAANLGLLGRFLRCFLGDSGARLLGFFLVFSLIGASERLLSPPGALFFVALPLLDLCAVFVERLRAGRSPMRADRWHLHYLLVDAGVGHRQVVVIMGLASLGFIGLHAVLHTARLGDLSLGACFVGLACLYWLGRRSLVRRLGQALAPRPVLVHPAE